MSSRGVQIQNVNHDRAIACTYDSAGIPVATDPFQSVFGAPVSPTLAAAATRARAWSCCSKRVESFARSNSKARHEPLRLLRAPRRSGNR